MSESVQKLYEKWERIQTRVAALKAELAIADTQMLEAAHKLGQAIAPADALEREQIATWVRTGPTSEGLVVVQRRGDMFDIWLRGHKEISK